MAGQYVISDRILISIVVVLLHSICFGAVAENLVESQKTIQTGKAFSLYLENDSRNLGGPGSDQAYSNGLKASYLYAEEKSPAWASAFQKIFQTEKIKSTGSKMNYGLSFGHQIYTPNSLDTKELILNDRPYVGWLYLGFSLALVEEKFAQFLEFDVGTIGPRAMGKEVQNSFHGWVHEANSEGWKNELHNELTLQIFFQQREKILHKNNFDLIPFYGFAVGNVQAGLHAGGITRFGWNLPEDFGPSRPSAGDGDNFILPWLNTVSVKKSFYGFGGVRGNLIFRNIFLDGNTFEASHRVQKNAFNYSGELGVGFEVRRFIFIWRFVTRSPEFIERQNFNSFASLNMIYFLESK